MAVDKFLISKLRLRPSIQGRPRRFSALNLVQRPFESQLDVFVTSDPGCLQTGHPSLAHSVLWIVLLLGAGLPALALLHGHVELHYLNSRQL